MKKTEYFFNAVIGNDFVPSGIITGITKTQADQRANDMLTGLNQTFPDKVNYVLCEKYVNDKSVKTWTVKKIKKLKPDFKEHIINGLRIGHFWTRPEQVTTTGKLHSDITEHLKGLEDYISTDELTDTVRIYYTDTILKQIKDISVNETVRLKLVELHELCKDSKFIIIPESY